MKAVLTAKIASIYDDLPEERYHFPQTYLRQIEAALNDWVVYYEPRRDGGRQCYFATARLVGIRSDPVRDAHYYAQLSDFLEFDRAVPFRDGEFYYESKLRKPDGSASKGAFGRSVRNLPDAEYDLILQAGFAHVIGKEPRPRLAPDAPEEVYAAIPGWSEEPAAYEDHDTERRLVTQISQRPFRDRAFAVAIKSAYKDTCAVTGLKIINGGGRSEVQAAHIKPVAHKGPDSTRNGVALSGTVHWMFDRGLISIDDDYRLLTAGTSVPDTIGRLIRPDARILLPDRPEHRPHPQYLKYHRESVFKG